MITDLSKLSSKTAISRRRLRGFSLIELAMVLLIVGLLLAGLVPTISSSMEQKYRKETTDKLDEIQQALIGFTITNDRLPCPASPTSSGRESFCTNSDPSSACGAPTLTPIHGRCSHFYNGFVPAVTLGISSVTSSNNTGYTEDAWGNRIRYAVTKYRIDNKYVFTTTKGIRERGADKLFSSDDAVHLLVCSTSTTISGINSDSSCGGNALTSNPGVPAVVFSVGKNGALGGGSPDESANLGDDRVFVNHTPTTNFDDIMTWPSPGVLINRMAEARTLL